MSNGPESSRASAALAAAEQAWESRDGARFAEAIAVCSDALAALPESATVERASLQVWIGRLLVASERREDLERGVASLEAGIAGLGEGDPMLPVAWMNHGSGLFRLGAREALERAATSYATAAELLRGHTDAASLNARGAACMNRGVALLHLAEQETGDDAAKARRASASSALLDAVTTLSAVATEDRAARRNLAATWSNLGMLRESMGEPAAAADAHTRAVAVSRELVAGGGWPEQFGLAARLLNLTHSAGEAGDRQAACTAAREAVALAGELAKSDVRALELALSARHSLCVTLAQGLNDEAALAEAGDVAEEGLAFLVTFDGRADEAARRAGARLYEFGAWMYRRRQPWFLAEFLLEHLDSERVGLAAEAVRQARQDMVQRGFEQAATGDLDRSREVLQSLAEVEEALKTLRDR